MCVCTCLCACTCLCLFIYMNHRHAWYLWRSEEHWIPGTGVVHGCEPPCDFGEITWVLCRAASALSHFFMPGYDFFLR